MKNVVKGLSPEAVDHEWSGCGWVETGRGKVYSTHDADMLAFDVNKEGVFVAWREEVCR